MHANTQNRKQYDEPFKQAAVQFFHSSGKSLDEVAAELGLSTADLKNWKRKYPPTTDLTAAKPVSHVAKLRAENQALRKEILQLKVQWDILKTTLGILSTTVSVPEKSL